MYQRRVSEAEDIGLHSLYKNESTFYTKSFPPKQDKKATKMEGFIEFERI